MAEIQGYEGWTVVSNGEKLNVLSGESLENVLILRGGSQIISNGAVIDTSVISSGGRQIVSKGGIASDTTVSAYGSQVLKNGGSAESTVVESSGIMYVSKGGIATGIVQKVGGLVYADVASGASTDISGTNASGVAFSLKDGVASNFIIYGGAAQNQIVSRGGSAVNTIVSSGGKQTVMNGGYASATQITSGGSAVIQGGATVVDAVVSDSGNITFYTSASGQNIVLADNAAVTLTVTKGEDAVITGKYSDNTAFSVANGVARNIRLANNGKMSVSSGAIASDTVVQNQGVVEVASAGTVVDTVVNRGGKMIVSSGGTAAATTVYAGASAVISSGGTHTGKLSIEEGAWFTANGTVDFNVSELSVDNTEQLVNDISRVQGTPGYTITISDSMEYGSYLLAGNAASMIGVTVTVNMLDGSESCSITVNGETGSINDLPVTLIVNDANNLIFSVINDGDQLINPFIDVVENSPKYLTIMAPGGSFAGGKGALAGNDYAGSSMIFGGAADGNKGDVFFYVDEVNNAGLMAFGGSLQKDVDGNIYMAVEDSTLNSVYGGSYQGDTGSILLWVTDSTIDYVYASAMGTVDGTEIVIDGTTTVKGEIQGSSLNANNTGDSIITVDGGTFGGNDYLMVYVGPKNAAQDSTETTITQAGSCELNINDGNFQNKTYFFGAGYAYGQGEAAKNVTICGDVNIAVNGGTFSGTGAIYGGGRADGKGTSLVEGMVSIDVSNITVQTGANWTVYGGGYISGAGICSVENDVNITISGRNNKISGVLNIFGAGDANTKATGGSSVGDVTIQIGEAARENNFTLNNVYGGGQGKSTVNGDTYIVFAGYGSVAMSGVLSGDGLTVGSVSGTKTLQFDRYSSTESLGITALTHFDRFIVDGQSEVSFYNTLDLSTVGAFEFSLSVAAIAEEEAILSFRNGVSDWNENVGFQIDMDDLSDLSIGSFTLISAVDSVDALAGIDAVLNFGTISVETLNLKIGSTAEFNGYMVGLELAKVSGIDGAADELRLNIAAAV